MRLTREALARRLATSPAILDNFEAGAITALPHSKETTRIVNGYCELMRIDPEPILWRITSQLRSIAAQARPSQPREPAAPQPPSGAGAMPRPPALPRAEPAKPRRRARVLFALSAPVALVALVAAMPQPVYRALALMPASIGNPVRALLDPLVLVTAPSREGLKWIEFNDPQLRKADKLQTSPR
jgi:hypothetical protein